MKITKYLKQRMLYWRKTGSNSSGPIYADGIEVICRWEDVGLEIIEPAGRRLITQSHVYTDLDMVEGSLVMLGPNYGVCRAGDVILHWKRQTYYPSKPNYDQGGREVKKAMRTPDLRATNIIKEWYLG
jgi:hypothetical protein